MERIVREIKELIEASEPDMTVVACSQDEPVVSPSLRLYGRNIASISVMVSENKLQTVLN